MVYEVQIFLTEAPLSGRLVAPRHLPPPPLPPPASTPPGQTKHQRTTAYVRRRALGGKAVDSLGHPKEKIFAV